MKRLAISTIFSFALVGSSFACVAETDQTASTAHAPLEHPNKVITSADAPAKDVPVEPVVFEVPEDPYAKILPFGAFADVKALCKKQVELVKPHLAEVNAKGLELEPDFVVKPSCKETPAVLANATVTLGGSFEGLKAISVETGNADETFLVVKTSEGWTALREAYLSAYHDDPGCGSIERENAFESIYVDGDALVVLTQSDRSWWSTKDSEVVDSGDLYLTKARACRFGDWGPTCSARETVTAKIARRPMDDPDAKSNIEEAFSTSFNVTAEGEIDVHVKFDETKL